MDLNEAMEKTLEVANEMSSHGAKDWDPKTRFIALVEEVGEIANALMLEHGDKPGEVRRAELADSICDALFDLFLLAKAYGIDLNKEYGVLLGQLRKRFKDGKFVGAYGLQEDRRA